MKGNYRKRLAMKNSDRKNIIQEVADSYVDRSLFSGIEWIAEKSG